MNDLMVHDKPIYYKVAFLQKQLWQEKVIQVCASFHNKLYYIYIETLSPNPPGWDKDKGMGQGGHDAS